MIVHIIRVHRVIDGAIDESMIVLEKRFESKEMADQYITEFNLPRNTLKAVYCGKKKEKK